MNVKRASITALGAVRVTVSTRLPRAALAAIVGAGVLVTLQSPVALAAGAPTYTVTATVPVGSDPDAVAVDPALHHAFVANYDDSTVSVVDTTTDTVVTSVPVGSHPRGLAVDNVPTVLVKAPAQRAAITPPVTTSKPTVFVGIDSGSLSVINAQTNTVQTAIPLSGVVPFAVAADPSTHRLFVVGAEPATPLGGAVAVVNESNNTVATTFALRDQHIAAAIDPNTHKVYLSNLSDPFLSILDGTTYASSTLDSGTLTEGVGLDPALHRVYSANGSVPGELTVLDENTGAIVTTLATDTPDAVAVDPATHDVYVTNRNDNTVSIFSGVTDQLLATVPVGKGPSAIAVDATTHTGYVTNGADNTVSVITRSVPTVVARLSGSDRFGTAVAVSKAEFPTGGAGAVVLARGDDYPDALVGAPLAAAKNAPLLLTSGATLPDVTKAEIQRVLPAGGAVFVLGGPSAVPTSVTDELTALGYQVTRYSGANRFETATKVADALGDPGTVLLATGVNFPDALSAGVAAVKAGGVVLLTNGTSLPTETSGYLSAHASTVYAVGGPAATADPSATPLFGADRYATSAAVAGKFFTAPASLGAATGLAFPDALSGGALLGHLGVPLVLVASDSVPAATATYLAGVKATVTKAYLFGGTSTITAATQDALNVDLTS